jgi:hypothetical protein
MVNLRRIGWLKYKYMAALISTVEGDVDFTYELDDSERHVRTHWTPQRYLSLEGKANDQVMLKELSE